MKSQFKSNYKLLGLNSYSTWPQAKSSYRRLVQLWHPDKFDDSSAEYAYVHQKFFEISKAYDQLKTYYKKYQKLPLEKDISEPKATYESEAIYLSREFYFSKRKNRSAQRRNNFPLFISIVLLVYLAYSSSSISTENVDNIQFFPDESNRSNSPIMPLLGNPTGVHLGLGGEHYFSSQGLSIGNVFDHHFNQSRR